MPTNKPPIKLFINGVETAPATKAKLRDMGKTLDEIVREREERDAMQGKEKEVEQ
jgi:hypothetical protein